MTVSFTQKVAEALPYTVGDGTQEYRTNPATRQKWTFAELTQQAHMISKNYNVDASAYLQEPQHEFMASA